MKWSDVVHGFKRNGRIVLVDDCDFEIELSLCLKVDSSGILNGYFPRCWINCKNLTDSLVGVGISTNDFEFVSLLRFKWIEAWSCGSDCSPKWNLEIRLTGDHFEETDTGHQCAILVKAHILG